MTATNNNRGVPTPLKMNNQSPLIPQGSLLEQKNKTRTRVKIAVIFVFALHGIGLLALLMQGCGHENIATPGSTSASPNSTNAGMAEPNPSFAATNTAPEPASTTSSASAPTNIQAQAPPPPENTNVVAPAPQPGVSEYKVLNHDTLSKIAKKFHVSLPALNAANPGVDPARLKVGQTIHIPAQTAAALAPPGPGARMAAATEGADGQQVYTVKSNDYLTKIAHQFGVTVKALRAANNLKTDRIKVGQKLKIPARTAAATEAAPAPAATGSSSNPPTPSGR